MIHSESRMNGMNKKKRPLSIENIPLSSPQRLAVAQLLAGQKNKYKKLLHEAHERMHIIGDLVSSLEIWINANGIVEFVSPSMLSLFGHPARDFLEKSVSFVHICQHRDLARLRQDLSASLEGAVIEGVEYLFMHRDGTEVPVTASWKPVRTRRDRIIGVRLSVIDMTRGKGRAANHSPYQALFYEHFLGRTDLPVCALRLDGTVSFWNAGAEVAFGWAAAERLGSPFTDLLPKKDAGRFAKLFSQASSEAASVHLELRHKDGKTREARLSVHGSLNDDGSLVEAVCIFHLH
jgi:PAS domain S-box-containing protein